MPSHLDALQTMTSVALRRLARDSHSVAKQASLKASFGCIPIRFWTDFGRFGGAKMKVQINFGVVFWDVYFDCVLTLFSDRFFWTVEFRKINKNRCFFSMVFCNSHKFGICKKNWKMLQVGLQFGKPTPLKINKKQLTTIKIPLNKNTNHWENHKNL